MLGAVQDRAPQAGVVLLTERRQDHGFGKLWADEPLAFQRRPNRRVPQPRRITGRDHRLAKMEMVAMWVGQLSDRNPARFIVASRLARQARQLLQER